MSSIYDFNVTSLTGKSGNLQAYAGKPLLIVNTASKCMFTPQFAGLEDLYAKYAGQGLSILGFPCNQFMFGERGDSHATEDFCQMNYGVTFPMFQKIKVNGTHADPLFKYLVHETGGHRIKWNFTKFLIAGDGHLVKRFEPNEKPETIEPLILEMLSFVSSAHA